MDSRELALAAEIYRSRQNLLRSAEAFRRSAVETFDPRERVRRHPVGGVLVSMMAGMMLAMITGRGKTAVSHPVRRSLGFTLVYLLIRLLPAYLPVLIDLANPPKPSGEAEPAATS